MQIAAGDNGLNSLVEKIRSRDDFVALVEAMLRDLRTNPGAWENPTLDRFLGAMAAWTPNVERYYQNIGEPMPAEPTWRMFGEILMAARIYE
jgi:hypothetical protein